MNGISGSIVGLTIACFVILILMYPRIKSWWFWRNHKTTKIFLVEVTPNSAELIEAIHDGVYDVALAVVDAETGTAPYLTMVEIIEDAKNEDSVHMRISLRSMQQELVILHVNSLTLPQDSTEGQIYSYTHRLVLQSVIHVEQ